MILNNFLWEMELTLKKEYYSMNWLFVGLGTFVHFAERKITELSDATPCNIVDRHTAIRDLLHPSCGLLSPKSS
jgi:hypothetical protein